MAGKRTTIVWPKQAISSVILVVIAFVLFLFVYLGNTTASSPVLSKIYFIRLNTIGVSTNATTESEALIDGGLSAYYQIGLWNQCNGIKIDGPLTFCSKIEPAFHFSLSSITGLGEINEDGLLPASAVKDLKAYAIVEFLIFTAYTIVMVSLLVAPVFIFFAQRQNRVAVTFTTLWLTLAAIFSIIASVTITALYLILTEVANANNSLQSHAVTAQFGVAMAALSWAGTLLTFAASIIWCCGPSRQARRAKKNKYSDENADWLDKQEKEKLVGNRGPRAAWHSRNASDQPLTHPENAHDNDSDWDDYPVEGHLRAVEPAPWGGPTPPEFQVVPPHNPTTTPYSDIYAPPAAMIERPRSASTSRGRSRSNSARQRSDTLNSSVRAYSPPNGRGDYDAAASRAESLSRYQRLETSRGMSPLQAQRRPSPPQQDTAYYGTYSPYRATNGSVVQQQQPSQVSNNHIAHLYQPAAQRLNYPTNAGNPTNPFI